MDMRYFSFDPAIRMIKNGTPLMQGLPLNNQLIALKNDWCETGLIKNYNFINIGIIGLICELTRMPNNTYYIKLTIDDDSLTLCGMYRVLFGTYGPLNEFEAQTQLNRFRDGE